MIRTAQSGPLTQGKQILRQYLLRLPWRGSESLGRAASGQATIAAGQPSAACIVCSPLPLGAVRTFD
jgi:hypothetical protein